MQLTDRELVYLSHIITNMARPDLYELDLEAQRAEVLNFGNIIISIIGVLPDNFTLQELDSRHYILRDAARSYLVTELADEPHGLSEQELFDRLDEEDVAGLAEVFVPLAEVVLETIPKLPLMITMIDWDSSSVDEELEKLLG